MPIRQILEKEGSKMHITEIEEVKKKSEEEKRKRRALEGDYGKRIRNDKRFVFSTVIFATLFTLFFFLASQQQTMSCFCWFILIGMGIGLAIYHILPNTLAHLVSKPSNTAEN